MKLGIIQQESGYVREAIKLAYESRAIGIYRIGQIARNKKLGSLIVV
jgi:hypothetical protein